MIFCLASRSLSTWSACLFLIATVTQPPGARAEETNLIPNPQFTLAVGALPDGWQTASPRPQLAPEASVVAGPEGGAAVSLHASRFEQNGSWKTLVRPIEGGSFYRFDVRHCATGVASTPVSVAVILTWWKTAKGTGELQQDYAEPVAPPDAAGWQTSARTLRAPAGARALTVQLVLRWAPGGSVVFSNPRLVQVPPPPPRTARIIATHLLPSKPATMAGNTKLMLEMLDKLADQHPDLVLFSENFFDRGCYALPLLERAQPIPGPLTDALAAKARVLHSYVVTTLHEVDKGLVYNTAVLIDRDGRVAGKYRKVHLSMAESEGGITPGSDYPVFDTDFARVGIVTCWDDWFPEPARILRLKGAEVILFPLAGDGVPNHYDAVTRTRAMDNGVYLVASPTLNNVPARIINPAGEVLNDATGPFDFAAARIDLGQEWRVRYLSVATGDGEAKSLYIKERRPDTYGELTGPTNPQR